MSQRKPVAAGNWKMNHLRRDAEALCQGLCAGLGNAADTADIVLFPGATLLATVAQQIQGTPIALGGQDLHPQTSGAHTGDVSGAQLADAGCGCVLCGHSERRQDHGEDDALIGQKAKAATNHGLLPLICLGESRDERHAGQTFEVLRRQLSAALAAQPVSFELAYEPIWAIGTGEVATPEIAQQAHAFLRQTLGELLGEQRAATTRILYGGSAKPSNVADLIVQPDIDGFLVGGASLDSGKF
ncbi:MAG: triose-phosphate isomerase, partial [Acidobacteriota bacterium]